MKEIIVVYWHGVMIESIGIEHNSSFEYSKEKRNEIVDLVIENKCQVMIYAPHDHQLVIWIDNGRFKQR